MPSAIKSIGKNKDNVLTHNSPYISFNNSLLEKIPTAENRMECRIFWSVGNNITPSQAAGLLFVSLTCLNDN
jgi:hypothetical protein